MNVGMHASTSGDRIETSVVDRLTADQGLHNTLKPYHELAFTHGTEHVTIFLAPAQLSAVADVLVKYQTEPAAPDLDQIWENFKASQYAREGALA